MWVDPLYGLTPCTIENIETYNNGQTMLIFRASAGEAVHERNFRFGRRPVTMDDLFKIDSQGVYRARIALQAFKQLSPGKWELLKFPVLEFDVRKR
jgi:hypothetical protein